VSLGAPGSSCGLGMVVMGMEFNGILGLIVLALDIWAILSIAQSRADNGRKVLWILLVLILPFIGFIIWYLAGPRGR